MLFGKAFNTASTWIAANAGALKARNSSSGANATAYRRLADIDVKRNIGIKSASALGKWSE